MRSKEFIGKLDHDRIVHAIRDAESKTSGQIRIYIQRGVLNDDALETAQKRFVELRMQETKERNAVLIYVAPRTHKLAVVGDQAIHEICGDALWQAVVSKMTGHFRDERFTDAMVGAIHELGAVLAEQFPAKGDGSNELPDEVIEG